MIKIFLKFYLYKYQERRFVLYLCGILEPRCHFRRKKIGLPSLKIQNILKKIKVLRYSPRNPQIVDLKMN
jgi:hypothetical protein